MGQYWRIVNLDKREYVDPYKLDSGAKLWEQLANPGPGQALIILCAAQPEMRGGGDLDLGSNWHGPERTDMTKEGPAVPGYEDVARRTIGRWAGDRIAIVGDYAEDEDLPRKYHASKIYGLCGSASDLDPEDDVDPKKLFRDVSADVLTVIKHEIHS